MTENQFNELFRMVSLTANKIQDVEKKIDHLEHGLSALQQGQDELRQGQDELRQGQDELRQGQDELRQGQDELRHEFTGFRHETQESLASLNREERLEVRRFKTLSGDMLTTRAQIDDLVERVERLEERDAA